MRHSRNYIWPRLYKPKYQMIISVRANPNQSGPAARESEVTDHPRPLIGFLR
jgi:hypothetical protein